MISEHLNDPSPDDLPEDFGEGFDDPSANLMIELARKDTTIAKQAADIKALVEALQEALDNMDWYANLGTLKKAREALKAVDEQEK